MRKAEKTNARPSHYNVPRRYNTTIEQADTTILTWGGGSNCGGGGGPGACSASISIQMVCANALRPSSLDGNVIR